MRRREREKENVDNGRHSARPEILLRVKVGKTKEWLGSSVYALVRGTM